MKAKFFIYLIPIFLVCLLVYGFSNVDDPRNDSHDGAQTQAPFVNGKVSTRGGGPIQFDTITQAGFPYPRVFNWNYTAITPLPVATVGAIQFNNRFYLNSWQTAAGFNRNIWRWNNGGTGGGPGSFVDSISNYNAGAGAIRDLTIAPDGSGNNYLWGGIGTTVLYKLDSLGNRLGTYTITGGSFRAIAWDPNRKGFWNSGFTGNIICHDTNGAVKGTIVVNSTDTIAGKYGLGFDSTSTPGQAFLWVWNQGTKPSITNANPNGGDEIIKYSLATGTIVGRWVVYRSAVNIGIAGGAEVQKIGATTYLFVNHQNFAVCGYDLSNPIPLTPNDVGTASISRPQTTELLAAPFTPSATVTNYGSNTQTFNVTMTIQPGGYTSTQTVTGLTSLSSTVVNFASYPASSAGSFTAKTYTQLGTDTNPGNDTATRVFTVVNPNYATTGGFSYSNSVIGSGAPSQPDYCWKDTLGSTDLCVNSVNANAGIFTGSLDDGYWAVKLPAGKRIRLGGLAYDSFFVATNGTVGFARQSGLTSFSPSQVSTNRPALYSLWSDMNLSVNASYPVNRVSYKVNGYQLIITYNRIPEFSPVGTDDYVTYQVVIDLVDPVYTADSRFLVQYHPTETGAGYLNFYNTAGLNAHVIGIQSASGAINSYYRAAYPVSPYGPMFGASPIAVQFGPDANRLNASCDASSLTLNASIEAITPNSSSDTITVLLRSSTAPYEIVDAAKGVLSASGSASLSFTKANLGSSYYIVVKHRNTIETWSANPVVFNANTSYDFTSGVSQAFGSNMVVISGEASFYSGDVNQDGIIDASDGSLIDNDAFNFNGGYIATDVNNDSFVDASDAAFVDNNAFNFIGIVRP